MWHRPQGRTTAATALLAVLSLLAAGCGTSAASATKRPYAPGVRATSTTTDGTPPASKRRAPSTVGLPPVDKIAWHDCGSFLCGRLVVPISYSDAREGTMRLALIELASTSGAKSAPDLVLNPGGPGESGVQFVQGAASQFPAGLRARFNLVSFDPRGVGASDPVECTTPAGLRRWIALDPAPSAPREIAAVIAATKAFDKGCARHLPRDVLANLSTATTARDMNRLREALGQAKLDYLGFSYGTYLGALYAQAYPTHVGHMVLDGAVDPALSSVALDVQQASSFEVDLHDFFSWCPANPSCKSELPGGAAAAYSTVMRRLKAGGTLTADMTAAVGGTQRVGYAIALVGVISSLYTTRYWPYLAQGLAEAVAGNGSLLTELAYSYAGFNANGTASNLVSANLAVSCLDRPVPPVAQYPSLARELAKRAPDFGPAEVWGSLACDYWPVPPTGKVGPIHLSKPLPILVVGSTHDPATPFAWAKALTSQLRGAELLTRAGDGHTGYFSSTCVQRRVDAYLVTGARPPAGTVCASGT